jgi:RNA polymerase sigma-70 factor, ECF subfamily
MSEIQEWIEGLYRDAGPGLLTYLTHRMADRAAAEDVLQETFAVALRNPARVQTAVSARAYLFGIARNLVVNRVRKTPVRFETLPEDLAAMEISDDPRLELMRNGIERLKPEFREALELRLRQELSYEEIAQALQIPVGTVRSRLHHAVQQLRRVLRHSEPANAL